jgi:hypothetical protein
MDAKQRRDREYMRMKRAADPDIDKRNRMKYREQIRARMQANREKLAAYRRAYRARKRMEASAKKEEEEQTWWPLSELEPLVNLDLPN